MHTRYIQKYFENNASGSGQRYTLSNDTIGNIPVLLPSVEEQHTIGKVLADIDRKIELNKQINDNLEAMAKQLYEYWFVQFDFPNEEGKPYKSSGGAMVWNEKLKREIPQGWNILPISDILDKYPTTKRYETKEYLQIGKYPIIDQGDAYIVGFTNENDNLLTRHPAVLFGDHSTKVKFLDFDFARGADGTQILYSSNDAVSQYYLYLVVSALQIPNPGYSRHFKYLKELPIVIPSLSIATKFVNIVKPLFEKWTKNIFNNIALTKQRDELLPLLMNGQASVNYHLSVLFLSFLILYRDQYKFYDMKETIIQAVLDGMRAVLTDNQLELLTDVTRKALSECEITPKATVDEQRNKENAELLGAFISSKKVEGCSDKTIHYYKSSIEKLITTVKKNVCDIATNDIRCYLADQQEQRGLSKVTIDNLRRIYSSFFSWLEDEDYITKSPVRRIHKVRTDALVKEVLTDENIEVLRDSCQELRDIAMIDLLLSTGMRVGELVKINREDIDFQERQCVVFGKGNKEREVYFNARTKIHLKKYLEQRTDTNPALFVSLHEPHTRLTISGVEVRLRQLGKRVNLNKVHPHKFRRTLATMAIDKGMPIEQVQKMLGHVKIDTTLHYAMVNQTNVKIAHRKFLN